MKSIKSENDTLLSIYKNRIKNTEQTEIEINIKNTEEKNKEKLLNIKNEVKLKEIKFKELENKLKEQRNIYSNYMTMINSIKNKIKDAKYLKIEGGEENKINYNEEIEKEQKNIEEEEKKLNKEENEYKKLVKKNDREINRLSILILEKKILLKNKRDNIRRQELGIRKKGNNESTGEDIFGNIKTIKLRKDNENEGDLEDEEIKQNGFFLTEGPSVVKNKKNVEIITTDINGGKNKAEEENGNYRNNNGMEKKRNSKSDIKKENEENEFNIDINSDENESQNDSEIENEKKSEKYDDDIDNHLENDLDNLSDIIIGEKNGLNENKDNENHLIKSNNFINSKID